VHSCEGIDSLKAMKREFGERLNQFLIVYEAPTLAQAQVFLDTAQT
jgi:hypothetical protein